LKELNEIVQRTSTGELNSRAPEQKDQTTSLTQKNVKRKPVIEKEVESPYVNIRENQIQDLSSIISPHIDEIPILAQTIDQLNVGINHELNNFEFSEPEFLENPSSNNNYSLPKLKG
jgi:hypothetical protein